MVSLASALELSVLVVCIWGFIAVLLTGQFHMAVIIGCVLALLVGYAIRRKGWVPSPLVSNLAAIGVFLLGVTIFAVTFNLLIATVHLFLFLQVTKYITRRTIEENRWCYVISLFNIIGASVITTTITFGIMLVVYVFLVVISLRLYVIAAEAHRAHKISGGLNPVSGKAVSAKSFNLSQIPAPRGAAFTSIFLTAIILVLAGGLFSVIPRLATQNLFQTYGPPQQEPAVSAFSENVEFGTFTEIQQDNRVAMFIQPVGDERPANVRMRGVALDTFDGRSWSRYNPETIRSGHYDFNPLFTTRLYPTQYTYRIIQPPGVTNFLFGDSFPLAIRVPRAFSFQVDRLSQSIYLPEMPPKEFQYEVKSTHEDLSLRQDPETIATPHRPVSQLYVNLSRFHLGRRYDDRRTSTGEFRRMLRHVQRAIGIDPTSTGMMEEDPEEFEKVINQEPEPDFVETSTPALEDFPGSDDDLMYSQAENSGVEGQEDHRRWRYGRPPTQRELHRLNRTRTGKQIMQRYLEKCTALPDTMKTNRIVALANEWTTDKETTFAKAMAIEQRLRTEFGYSLVQRARGNYIESFLFDVREGHCEYFATSMAVLLRNLGIPARIVNGYYSSEWNAMSGNFTARQKDAHSWVEVWMSDTYGWMTFDPTPPGGVSRRINRGQIIESLTRMMDAAKVRWYRYVVDYSITDQVMAMRRIMEWRRQFMAGLDKISIFGIGLDDAMPISLGDFTGEIDWRPVALAGCIIVVLLALQLIRWIVYRRRDRLTTIRFYDDLLRLLRKNGITMTPGQTPKEFARTVSDLNPNWTMFETATDLYYHQRFNPEAASLNRHDFSKLAELRQEMKRTLGKRKQQKKA